MLDLLIHHCGVRGHVIDPANYLNLKDLARLKARCGQENRDTVDFVNKWIELPTKIHRYQSLTALPDFS
jgi:hypothetical protein